MKKRLIISSVISIFLVSVLLLGSTYSIFTSQEIDESANVYKTGNLNVKYSIVAPGGGNSVQITDSTPMTVEEADAVIPYRVTVTNSGNVPYEFDVILMDTTSSEENTIDYQYIMTKVGYLDPVALSNCTNNIIKENVIVPAGEKVDIDVRIWLDSMLPNIEMGKSFYAKLKIEGLAVYNDDEYIDNSKLSLNYMKSSSLNDFRNDSYRTYIKTASFVDYIDTSNASINTDTNEKIMWDMSTAKDESVIAWLEDNGEVDESGSKLYNLYIGSEEKIYSASLSYAFAQLKSLKNVIFSNLDTSLTTDMSGMFDGCSSLVELDLSSFDVINVTSMGTPSNYGRGGMFMGCTSLKTLNLDNWNTSKVNQIGNMFRNCESLTNLDLSSFDTSSVTNFARLFDGCLNLTSLNLSNFNTGNVTDMYRMFASCFSLENLDLSSFDTGNVTNMQFMFSVCKSLENLDLSSFDTGNVINMQSMFFQCFSLVELDISNFDTSKVSIMHDMFNYCSSLVELDLSSFDTGNVTNMQSMFYDCRNLEKLDISSFDTSQVTDMGSMFHNCYSLEDLDLSSFDTSNVTDMAMMFYFCSKLQTSLVINSNSVIDYTEMFRGATTIEGSSIVLYYVGDNPLTTDVNESTYDLVEVMIATKSSNSNIINGGCVGNYCSV